MNRRAFLAAVAGGSVGGLAGCAGTGEDPGESTPTRTTVDAPSLAEQGRPPDVCAGDVIDLGIYAVEDPAHATDWSGVEIPEQYAADGRLDGEVVVGVEREGTPRAYPLPVLWYHEVVNDVVGPSDDPVLVTFCSLCRSGMVAERRVAGEVTTFGVSGQLWRPPELRARASEDQDRVFAVELDDPDPEGVRNTGNLVMFDVATGSYWSQLLARAICGHREGETLRILPSTTAVWEDWRREHPDTDVLLPPPHSDLQEIPG